MDVQDRHNRIVMLQRVKLLWLKGVLEESLHGAELLDLNMATRPNAVAGAHAPGWQQGDEFDTPLPIGKKIWQVYDEAGGELLIMGSPGAGKTTTLLQLVTVLVERADLNEQQPVPVVLSLATWQGDKSLAAWMVDELANQYEVPRKLGQAWIGNGRLLPLLDGLDEVEQELRPGCAQAINQFRSQYPYEPLVVTSRSQDYKALDIRLSLSQAIILQPLSLEQIDIYLASVGKRLAGLRAALQTDVTLRELAQTPLMLSIMTLAYYRMPADIAISLGGGDLSRKLLFDVYVERMTRYRGGDKEYAPEDAVRWLAWLAQQMAARNKTMFFLEGLQPNGCHAAVSASMLTGSKLVVGLLVVLVGLVGGMIGLLVSGWPALAVAGGLAVVVALLPVLFGRFLLRRRVRWFQIETTETLDWSWPHAWFGSGAGAIVGALIGLPLSLIGDRNWSDGLPWALLLAGFIGLSQMLENALVRNDVKLRTTPGQGIERSQRNGWLVGGVSAAVTAVTLLLIAFFSSPVAGFNLVPAMAWIIGGALYLGLVGGMLYGGLAVLQHRRLLAILQEDGVMPPDYVHFLDYAAERNLLRKVGGGYMFAHALLLDYFTTYHAVQDN